MLQFTDNPLGDDGAAITLGHAIIYFGKASPETFDEFYKSTYETIDGITQEELLNMGYHEKGHIPQAEALGPLYIPVHLISGGWWDNANPLEQSANAYAREMMKRIGIYNDWNPNAK